MSYWKPCFSAKLIASSFESNLMYLKTWFRGSAVDDHPMSGFSHLSRLSTIIFHFPSLPMPVRQQITVHKPARIIPSERCAQIETKK